MTAPFIPVELDALNQVPAVARAAGVEDARITHGLVTLWAHCFRRKEEQVNAIQLRGFFGADVGEVLVAFGFLAPPTGADYRVRGARRFAATAEARRRGGLAAKGNLIPGGPRALDPAEVQPTPQPSPSRESGSAASRLPLGSSPDPAEVEAGLDLGSLPRSKILEPRSKNLEPEKNQRILRGEPESAQPQKPPPSRPKPAKEEPPEVEERDISDAELWLLQAEQARQDILAEQGAESPELREAERLSPAFINATVARLRRLAGGIPLWPPKDEPGYSGVHLLTCWWRYLDDAKNADRSPPYSLKYFSVEGVFTRYLQEAKGA